MTAGTNLPRPIGLAIQLGYDEPGACINSVVWQTQSAPMIGEGIIGHHADYLSRDAAEVVCGEDDLSLREAHWKYLQSFANTNKHIEAVLPEAFGMYASVDGFREGCILPEFGYTPQGKNKTEIRNSKMYSAELPDMRLRQVDAD